MAERVVETLLTLAAVIVALGVIWKFPPFRKPVAFIGRRVIAEPVGEWFRHLVREEATTVIRSELKRPNGGASIPDISAQLTEMRKYTHDGQHEIKNMITPLKGQIDMVWKHLGMPSLEEEE